MSMTTDHPEGNHGEMRPPASEGVGVESTDGPDHADALNGHAPQSGDAQPSGAEELKPIIEALLFVSHEPVTLERLTAALGMVSKAEVRQALAQLQAVDPRYWYGMAATVLVIAVVFRVLRRR